MFQNDIALKIANKFARSSNCIYSHFVRVGDMPNAILQPVEAPLMPANNN